MRVTAQEVSAALSWGFRPRRPEESVEHYRKQLIDHVENRNVAAAFELRLGRKRSDWTQADQEAFKDYLLETWTGGPSSTFNKPLSVFNVGETTGHPVTEDELRTIARATMAWGHDKRRADAKRELPIIAGVLCSDGRFLYATASRDERKAILAAWIQTQPVFGYVMFSDAYIHAIDMDPETKAVKGTSTRDALMMHVGSRTGIRDMWTWMYRLEGPRAIFEDEPRVIDKSKEQTQDPYADLFAAAPAQGVQ